MLWLRLLTLLHLLLQSRAFILIRTTSTTRRRPQLKMVKRLPGESSEAFFQRLTRAASDPAQFEALALGSTDNNSTDSASSSTSAQQQQQQPKTGYVRVEEWDEQQRSNANSSWEEQVQFDGQRYGNGFQQNEILRKNLKYYG